MAFKKLRKLAGPSWLRFITWSRGSLVKIRYLHLSVAAGQQLRAYPKTIAVFLPETIHLNYVNESLKILNARGFKLHIYTKSDHIDFYRAQLPNAQIYPYTVCTMVRYKLVVTPSTPFLANAYRHPESMVVHLPHSMVSLHVVFTPQTFANFDAILSCGPHHCAESAAIFKHLGKKSHIIPVGYQRIDDLARTEAPKRLTKSRPVVLIAPTWGEIGLLARFGVGLVDSLISDFDIILRPHFWQLSELQQQLGEIVEKYGENPGFQLDLSSDSTNALLSADVMLSDCSGVAFEFAFACLRPVIFIEGPKKCFNESWMEIYPEDAIEYRCRIELGIVIPDLAGIIQSVHTLVADRSEWEQRLHLARNRHLHHFGRAGAKTADALESLFDDSIRLR